MSERLKGQYTQPEQSRGSTLVTAEEPTTPREGIEDTTDVITDDTLGLYFRSINNEPLLEAGMEVELSRVIKRGSRAKENLEVLQKGEHGLIITDSEREGLERQIQQEIEEGNQAFNRFVNANLRLVVWAARRHMRCFPSSVELIDLIQYGNEGLIKAVEKFDPDMGYKFSTYATWWINQKMRRGVADYGRDIRIPVGRLGDISKIRRAYEELLSIKPRNPSIAELSEESGIREEVVHELFPYVWNRTVSLNRPLGSEASDELGDTLAAEVAQLSLQDDEDKDDTPETYLQDSTNPAVIQAKRILSERQWSILCDYYNLRSGSHRADVEIWEEIAGNRGIQPFSARRTLYRALKILRQAGLEEAA